MRCCSLQSASEDNKRSAHHPVCTVLNYIHLALIFVLHLTGRSKWMCGKVDMLGAIVARRRGGFELKRKQLTCQNSDTPLQLECEINVPSLALPGMLVAECKPEAAAIKKRKKSARVDPVKIVKFQGPSTPDLTDCSAWGGKWGEIRDNSNTLFYSKRIKTNIDNFVTEESLRGICIDVKHRYAGDLTVKFTCPSGQSVLAISKSTSAQVLDGRYCFAPNGTVSRLETGERQWLTAEDGAMRFEDPSFGLNRCSTRGQWTASVTDSSPGEGGCLSNLQVLFKN
eukprot:m.118809 g.118809  ORF g.118809 m.118809 type:complete len:283 (-) comp13665_c1_seq1:119-967(-)